MGYFNTAYTVFSLFFVLSGSGIPTALSLTVARDLALGEGARAERRFVAMRRFSLVLGLFLTVLLLLFAKPLAFFLGSPLAYHALLAVAPAVLFVTLSAPIRGFCQGQGDMLPTALSQLAEAFLKLLFGLLLVYTAKRMQLSLFDAAAFAILGLSLSTALSFLILAIMAGKRISRRGSIHFDKPLFHDTLAAAIPVTVSSLAVSLAASLDLLLLMRALQSIGYTPDMANAAWGNYSALVLPLFHMPQVLLTPIAYAVLPALRALVSKGERNAAKALTKTALRVTAILGALCALGLSLFSRDALMLLYRDGDAVARAYPNLSLLAIAIFPLGIMTVTASLLQANGKLWLPTVTLTLGALVKILVTVFGVSTFGESVSAIGTLFSYTVSAALNLAALSVTLSHSLWTVAVIKPFALSVGAVLSATVLRTCLLAKGLPKTPVTLLSIALAAAVALFLAFLLKALTKEDFNLLGIGKRKQEYKG